MNKTAKNFSQLSSQIEMLKELNSKKEFVSKLSDKNGLPVWDKMIVTSNKSFEKSSDSISNDNQLIVIPLRENTEYLSSVLYVKIDNGILTYNNVTNSLLKDFVFDTSISVEKREEVLMAYLYADYHTYHIRNFSHLPEDLLVQHKIDGGITIADDHETTNDLMAPYMECVYLSDSHRCTCLPGSIPTCDGCPQCVSLFCSVV